MYVFLLLFVAWFAKLGPSLIKTLRPTVPLIRPWAESAVRGILLVIMCCSREKSFISLICGGKAKSLEEKPIKKNFFKNASAYKSF